MHPVQVSSYFGQIHSDFAILHGTEHPTAVHLFTFFCPLFAPLGKLPYCHLHIITFLAFAPCSRPLVKLARNFPRQRSLV